MTRKYKLTAPDGGIYETDTPGLFGGYRAKKIYGRLDCQSAIRHLPNYAKARVFFADEATAIAAGYRPCAKCMKERYKVWNRGGELRTSEYPWHQLPKK